MLNLQARSCTVIPVGPEASTAILTRFEEQVELHSTATLTSHLPELEVLPFIPGPGVGPLTGGCQSVHNLLVQDRHSQVEHPHDEDDRNAGKRSQL